MSYQYINLVLSTLCFIKEYNYKYNYDIKIQHGILRPTIFINKKIF
jgi:hypothetical protein